jgi:broad specificity phosphatase PhoE
VSRVWFIRHGQSEANAGLRSVTASDIPLTALGVQQAQAAAARFTAAPERLIVSPYLRAQQTALPLQARFPAVPVALWPVQEFTFLAPARCRDTTAAERLPMVTAFWSRADPDYRDAVDVESFRDLLTRVDQSLAKLRALAGHVAVYTHGQWIQTALWRLGQGPQPSGLDRMVPFRTFMQTTPIPNASILEVELGADAVTLSAPLIDHLHGLPLTH